jgi:hypothetical protein
MQVHPKGELLAVLGILTGVAGRYENATVHLFQNDFTPTPDTVIADLTEATFSGYAAVVDPGWGAAFLNDDGNAQRLLNNAQFTQTAATITNTVYGYYVTDAAGTGLWWAERFATPVLMDAASRAIAVIGTLVHGQG